MTSPAALAFSLVVGAAAAWVLARTAGRMGPGWVLWRRTLLAAAAVVVVYPLWWGLAVTASESMPGSRVTWVVAVLAVTGHLPVIAAFTVLPLQAVHYLGRTSSRMPAMTVVTLGLGATLTMVMFFDDFAPLEASAPFRSSAGTAAGMTFNALFLATVLLGPVTALVAAWRAHDAAARRLALVGASSLAGTLLVLLCGALGAAPGLASRESTAVLLVVGMDAALVIVAVGSSRGLTAPVDAPAAVSAPEPAPAPAAAPEPVREPTADPASDGPSSRALLTAREAEVLELLSEGLSNAGIAARLVLSERTVDAHLRSVFHKLDLPEGQAHNRRVHAAATVWAASGVRDAS